MRLAREKRALWQIDRELGHAAPRMRADFCAFTRAYSGQTMPRQERIMHGPHQLWRALRRLLMLAVFMTVMVAGGGLDRARHAARQCAGRPAGRGLIKPGGVRVRS